MSKIQKLSIFVFFILGAVFFFPIGSLESRLNDSLSKAIGGEVRVMNPRLSFGFKTGIVSGGLIGIKADEIEINLAQSSQPIHCYEPVISPKFLAILILRLQIAVSCDLGKEKSPIMAVVHAPIFNPTKLSANLEVENLSLSEVTALARISGISGRMSGEISIAGLEGQLSNAELDWGIQIQNLETPALNTDFGSLPPMSFTTGFSQGSSASSKVKMDVLKMGLEGTDALVTDLQIELGFASNGNLTNGYIQGNLKSTSDFDNSMASLVKMDQVFGKTNPNGYRRFKKPIQGNLLSLLAPPEELP